jgi:hypothetical protein
MVYMSRWPFDEPKKRPSLWKKYHASRGTARDPRSAWANAEASTFSEADWKKVARGIRRSKQMGREVAGDVWRLECNLERQKKCPERKPTT